MPLRSSRSIIAPVTRAARAGEAEDEVDPHTLLFREAELRVIPVGVDAGPRGVRADDILEAGLLEGVEGGPLRLTDVGQALARKKSMSQTSSSCGAILKSPISAICAWGSSLTQVPAWVFRMSSQLSL